MVNAIIICFVAFNRLTFCLRFATLHSMKKNLWKVLGNYIRIIFASLLAAFSTHIFILPNKFVAGGISGIAGLLEYTGVLPAKYGIYLLNIPLLILAVIYLSKEYALKTIISATVNALFLILFDVIKLPVFTSEKIVAVFIGGILTGLSMIYAYMAGGSNGGTEIVAQLVIKKDPEKEAGQVMFVINILIMSVGGFLINKNVVFDLWVVVYSLLMSYISSSTYRILNRGFDPALKYIIITNKPNELSKQFLIRFRRGVSSTKLINPDGTPSEYTKVVVIIQYRQNVEMKKWLSSIDKECFAFSVQVDDVVTRPNFNKRYRWKI